MPISLSGFARDKRGFGRNGVQVMAIDTTSNLVVTTTTTVNHPTTGERGWWSFTDLPDATYRVEIQWPGDTVVVSGEEKRQFAALYVSNQREGATSVADGDTISHGLASTPSVVFCTPSVAGEMVSVTVKGATTFTVAIKKADGTAGTTQTVYWRAVA